VTEHRGTPTRTKARKRALDILFEADLRDKDARQTLAERIGLGEPPVRPFTIELVEGVREHAAELDALLASCLDPGWALARMPRVDRNLARNALYELTHTDTPPSVVVNEAVDLAAELSTDRSPAFLNGVLGRAMEKVAERAQAPQEQ